MSTLKFMYMLLLLSLLNSLVIIALDLKMDFAAKQGHEYTQDCREFALTLHLHGPKAYKYLRETRHVPLPHPQTLKR